MITAFKHKTPANALILLLYGLIIKFPLFLHPVTPQHNRGDNYLYLALLKFLHSFTGDTPIVFSLLAFLLLFAEATLLNRIINSLRLFPRQNYLAGMSYLLVTSMIPGWSSFSAPLLVNGLLIWIWYKLLGLYNNNKPRSAIFNVSVLVSLLPLIYAPAIAYIILLLLAVIILRPFRITELLVALLGVLTPYYFFFVLLYLTNQWTIDKIVPAFTFYLPRLSSSLWVSTGIILLLIPFLIGGYYVQDNLNKMLIQMRKGWSLLLLLLLVSLLIILISPDNNYTHWIVIAVPIAAFHAATYFYLSAGSGWPATLLHWISFAFVVMLNYTS
jgi:hypothetical protein